jgi:hypothetical protein
MIRCTLFLRIRMLRRRRSSICCGRAIRPICLAIARRSATRGAARRFCDRYSPAIFLRASTARRCPGARSCRLSVLLMSLPLVTSRPLCRPISSPRSRSGSQPATSTASNRRHSLHPGELVRVTAGAFEDMIGTLIELRDRNRVVVLLEWLGRTGRAQLRAEAVEAA